MSEYDLFINTIFRSNRLKGKFGIEMGLAELEKKSPVCTERERERERRLDTSFEVIAVATTKKSPPSTEREKRRSELWFASFSRTNLGKVKCKVTIRNRVPWETDLDRAAKTETERHELQFDIPFLDLFERQRQGDRLRHRQTST